MWIAPKIRNFIKYSNVNTIYQSPNGQLGSALNQSLPVLGGDSTGNLSAEGLVGHHQHLQLLHVVDQHLLEAGGEHVPGAGGGAITNVWHLVHALELPPHSVVNTLWWNFRSTSVFHSRTKPT